MICSRGTEPSCSVAALYCPCPAIVRRTSRSSNASGGLPTAARLRFSGVYGALNVETSLATSSAFRTE
jgi:hypothetical protein